MKVEIKLDNIGLIYAEIFEELSKHETIDPNLLFIYKNEIEELSEQCILTSVYKDSIKLSEEYIIKLEEDHKTNEEKLIYLFYDLANKIYISPTLIHRKFSCILLTPIINKYLNNEHNTAIS